MSHDTDAAPAPPPATAARHDGAVDTDLLRAVETYYEETWFDYRFLWMNRQNRALHFGWWDATARTHAESLDRINHVLAGRAGIGEGDRVLDAGCGVGGSAFWLAETFGSEVVGITISGEQVYRAGRYARDRGLSDLVRFEQQDYTATTFPDGSFSVVWAQESFCHAADKAEFLAEAARLLRPGGRLVMHDYVRADPAPARGTDHLRAMLDGWVLTEFPTAADLERWAAAAGLADLTVEDTSESVRRSLRHLYRITLPFAPFLDLMHRRGWRSDGQHGNLVGSLGQWRAFRAGQWYPAIVLARR